MNVPHFVVNANGLFAASFEIFVLELDLDVFVVVNAGPVEDTVGTSLNFGLVILLLVLFVVLAELKLIIRFVVKLVVESEGFVEDYQDALIVDVGSLRDYCADDHLIVVPILRIEPC